MGKTQSQLGNQPKQVKETTKALNRLIKEVGLSLQLEPSAWCRNIFKQSTEIAYLCGNSVLTVDVLDSWIEDRAAGDLEQYLGMTITGNLTALYEQVVSDATATVDFKRCDCGCCHVPDNGACQKYEVGANGRCVYCDHGKDCHPGDPKKFNAPLGI